MRELIVFVAILLSACSRQETTSQDALKEIETAIDRDPTTHLVAEEMRRDFPKDYTSIISDIGRSRDLLDNQGYIIAHKEFLKRLNAFMASKRGDLVDAPDKALIDVAKAQHQALLAAAKDPNLCAAFGTGSAASDPKTGEETASEAFKQAAANLSVAQIKAVRAAIDTPVKRPSTLNPEIAAAFLSAAQQSSAAAHKVFSGIPVERLSPVEKCEFALATSKAITTLPEPQGSAMMSASFKRTARGTAQ